MSSFDYARIMTTINQERAQAIGKAIEVAPEIVEMNARKTIAIEPHIFAEAIKQADLASFNSTSKGHNTAININDSEIQFDDVKSKRVKSTSEVDLSARNI